MPPATTPTSAASPTAIMALPACTSHQSSVLATGSRWAHTRPPSLCRHAPAPAPISRWQGPSWDWGAAARWLFDRGGTAEIPKGGSGTQLRRCRPRQVPKPPAFPGSTGPSCAPKPWQHQHGGGGCLSAAPSTVPANCLLQLGLLPALVSLCLIGYCCQGSHLSSAAHTGAGANPADAVQTPSVRSVQRSRDAKAAGAGALPLGTRGCRPPEPAECLGRWQGGKVRTR